jgi:ribosome-binding factor A
VKHTAARLGQEIHSRLAQILREQTGDPRLELLSLVEVQVAPDASFARIFYRTLGDRAETAAALDKAKPYLRRRLAGELRVRRVPELDFRADETLDRAEHLEGVLRDLAQERRERGTDPRDKGGTGEGEGP